MSAENSNSNGEQPSYPLFNLEALKKASEQSHSSNMIPSASMTILTDKAFLKKASTFEQNIDILTRKRGRKPKKGPTKDINAADITLKEIIEDQQSGIPTTGEIKKKEEKLRKMQEGRAKKNMAKALKQGESECAQLNLSLPSSSRVEGLEEEKKQPAEKQGDNSTATATAPLTSRIIIVDGKPVIERPAMELARNEDAWGNKLVQVDKPGRLTSMSFKNRVHTEKWTPEENRKFYKALEIFGSDFGLISKLFKNRSRKQIKNKFHKEEKQNTLKIDTSLKRHRKYNFKSVHEKITALNKAMISEYGKKPGEEEISYQTENRLEKFDKVDNISRNNSAASSVDSMDLNIMNEIQEIFNSEIEILRNKKNISNVLFLAPDPHLVLPIENGQ